MKINKSHIKSIDAMRTIAILAVVLIHTTTKVLETTHYDLATYSFSLFLNQLARFAVPLFFLISGFVLELSAVTELNYWSYIKKRFSKIVIPYIFWSLIYYYFVYNQNHDNLIHAFLTGDASYQLYFIPTLCIFYALFPFLHKIYKFIANSLILVLIGALQFWFLYHDYFIKHAGTDSPVRIATLSFFVFIIGMVAARNKERLLEFAKKWRYFLAGASALAGFYVFDEGKNLYYKIYNIGAIYSQYRPSVLVFTILIGLLFFYIFRKVDSKMFSQLSYLVFFIHVIILEEIWKYLGHNLFDLLSKNAIGRISFDPIFFILTASASFGAAYLIHKVPFLSKITG